MISLPGLPGPRMLDAALRYAARGWAVFPLAPRSKVPLVAKSQGGHGHRSATTSEPQVRAWWTRWPTANIGLATGGRSGVDVLDVDPRNGGAGTLARLTAQNAPLPDTAESATGGGGRHIFFRSHPGVRCAWAREPGPGLDVKAEGGYVVAPPSVHPSGRRYAWRRGHGPIAHWPDWLLGYLAVPDGPAREPDGLRRLRPAGSGGSWYGLAVLRRACQVVAAAPEGRRHVTLRSRARVVAGYVATAEIEEALARAALEAAAADCGLPEREARTAIAWAFDHGMRQPLRAPGRSR